MPDAPILRHRTAHGLHRAAAYPPIADQLDAVAKGFRALIDGKPLPPETVAWVEACEAVKARFPKRAAAPVPGEISAKD